MVHDAGAGVKAGPGRGAIDERTVRCRAAGSTVIDAGDGNNAVALPSGPSFSSIVASGGDGTDTLTGAGSLYGGAGDDVLTG